MEMEVPKSTETRWSRVAPSLPVRNVQDLACPEGLTEETLRYIRLDIQEDEVLAEQYSELVNHGIPEEIIASIRTDIERFFKLPLEHLNPKLLPAAASPALIRHSLSLSLSQIRLWPEETARWSAVVVLQILEMAATDDLGGDTDGETQALMAVNAGFGNSAKALVYWDDGRDYCIWRGVACDRAFFSVIGLDLKWNKLSSQIPSEDCVSLKYLYAPKSKSSFIVLTPFAA
nr:unnamed protein product [Digitaria exilis]